MNNLFNIAREKAIALPEGTMLRVKFPDGEPSDLFAMKRSNGKSYVAYESRKIRKPDSYHKQMPMREVFNDHVDLSHIF